MEKRRPHRPGARPDSRIASIAIAFFLGGWALAGCAMKVDEQKVPAPGGSGGSSPIPMGTGGAAAGGYDAREPSESGSTVGGTEDGGKNTCQGPGFPEPAVVSYLSSRVALQEGGQAVADLLVLLCGTDTCNRAIFDPGTGYYVSQTDIAMEMVGPMLKTGDGTVYVEMGFPVRTPTTDFGVVQLIRLPDKGTGAALAAGTDATSGGVVLSLAAGTEIVMDEYVYDTDEAKQFRAVIFESAKLPPYTEAPKLDLVIGSTPNARFCPPATLTLPNRPNWPPGTRVEIHHQGFQADQEWAPYGGWTRVATATVTSDGLSIRTDADSGVPEIGLLGLHKVD